ARTSSSVMRLVMGGLAHNKGDSDDHPEHGCNSRNRTHFPLWNGADPRSLVALSSESGNERSIPGSDTPLPSLWHILQPGKSGIQTLLAQDAANSKANPKEEQHPGGMIDSRHHQGQEECDNHSGDEPNATSSQDAHDVSPF